MKEKVEEEEKEEKVKKGREIRCKSRKRKR